MPVPSAFPRLEPQLQRELRFLLDGRNQPLYRMVEYQLGWTDEHGQPANVRPLPYHGVACLLAAEAWCGDSTTPALPAAAAVELANQFVRVHSDIQDGTPNVGGRMPVWWVWGPAQAINAGDGFHALARLSLARLSDHGIPPRQVLDLLAKMDQACLEICEAQFLDLTFQERLDITLDTYTRIAEARSGALLGCALEAGALLGGAPLDNIDSLRRAGRALGLAMQVRSELAVFWERVENSPVPGDMLNKRKTLPYVLGYQAAPTKTRRELGSKYMQRTLEPGDLTAVATTLASVGAREASQQRLQEWTAQAFHLLDAAKLPEAKGTELHALFSFLANEPRMAL